MTQLRAFIIGSTVVAAIVEGYLATIYVSGVFSIAVAGFLVMLFAGARWRRVAMPVVMASLYLTPGLFLLTIGDEGFGLDVIWFLPLLGLILSDRPWQWSLPERWRWPLITWSALVALVWPIVMLRELDFSPWIVYLNRVSNTSDGTPPLFVAQNITYFAVGHNTGILLIDALFRWYRSDRERFRREALAPMAVAAAVAAAVAIYQGFVDLTFLNRGFWAYMIRASGTLADPNKLGSVAAFWVAGCIVLLRRRRQPWRMLLTAGAIALGAATVWVSGSRTGLAAVIVGLAIALFEGARSWRANRAAVDPRKIAIGAAGALALALVLAAVLQNASTHTIVQRGTLGYLPFIGDRGIAASANELLWERFGYGPAAIQMISEYPIEGVGIGTFHPLSHDFGILRGYALAPDNAQMWLRHNLAEFGLLGSLPMLWWCVVLLGVMFTRPAGDRLSFGILRGTLIGFGVASTFGMPTQANAIAMTFWVFVFWLWTEAAPVTAAQAPAANKPLPTPLIAAGAAIVLLHAGMTAMHAFGDLRPANRAERWNWYYRHGYHTNETDKTGTDLEPDPGGQSVGRRLTMKDSLAVIPVKGKALKFVAWIDHPDADVRPVHARVWADSNLVFEGDLRREPLMLTIPATPGKSHLRLETSIDRTWRPSDHGSRDRRELGLSIRDWVWE
jgi:hypothetical protein